MVARACLDKTCHPPSVALFSCQWLQLNMDNFKFPFAFASKRKKLDALDGLSQFSWHETASQEVIGQGSFGAVFITRYQTTAKPAETVVWKKLLHTASDFTETFIKEAKILNGLEHENIVSFKAVCKEPLALMMQYVHECARHRKNVNALVPFSSLPCRLFSILEIPYFRDSPF